MGFNIDKTANLFPEGLFLLEVSECSVGHSKKSGDAYLKVKLRDVFTSRTLYENWMVQGNGQGMTVPKLKALEIDLDGEVEPGDLLGRRMIAKIKHKDSDQYGTQAQIGKCWPENAPPKEWTDANPGEGSPDLFDGKEDPAPAKTDDGSEIPF